MNEERKMILQMLYEGAISVEEAENLLNTLSENEPPAEAVAMMPVPPSFSPKRIIVRVVENGKSKVNVKVPFSLVRVGLKLGQTFSSLGSKYVQNSPEARDAMEILKNIDLDELLSSISDGEITLPYTLVEVDDEEKATHVVVGLE